MAAIGIDFGISYSCVSIFENGRAVVIPNELGNKTTSSTVCLSSPPPLSTGNDDDDDDGDHQHTRSPMVLVGDSAHYHMCRNPISNTIIQIKRLLGKTFDDPCVQLDMHLCWSFGVVGEDDAADGRKHQQRTEPAEKTEKRSGYSYIIDCKRDKSDEDEQKPLVEIVATEDRSHSGGGVSGDGGARGSDSVYLLHPEQIAAKIISKMKHIAEMYLNNKATTAATATAPTSSPQKNDDDEKTSDANKKNQKQQEQQRIVVDKAVISVPSYFSDSQRQAIKDAGAIAGLQVLRLINASTAAAISYGAGGYAPPRVGAENTNNNSNNPTPGGERSVLVVDVGGGATDVCLLTLDDGIYEVKAAACDQRLGGEDFDSRLVHHFLEEIRQTYGAEKMGRVAENRRGALYRLRKACERCKCALSDTAATQNDENIPVEVENIFDYDDHDADDGETTKEDAVGGVVNFSSAITREYFELLCGDLCHGVIELIKRVIDDENNAFGPGVVRRVSVTKKDIDDVVLVGGSSRIPKIRRLIAGFFSGDDDDGDGDGDNNIFTSSSRKGGTKTQQQRQQQQQSMANFLKKIERTSSQVNNPDEAVAVGAAMQAFILSGGQHVITSEMLVLDIQPVTIGLETAGGVLTPLIRRNTTLPCKKTQVFSTYADNQPAVVIRLFEGDGPKVEHCRSLGKFTLDGISPAPKGVPQIEVTMDIDANGILSVSALDKSTGRCAPMISVRAEGNVKSKLTGKVIDRMRGEEEKSIIMSNNNNNAAAAAAAGDDDELQVVKQDMGERNLTVSVQ